MALLGPNYFSAGAADGMGWGHFISHYCCQWLYLGPIISLQALPMTLDWPLAFAGGAANGIAWAQLLFESCFQCPGMGPISPSAAAAANGIA